MGTSRVLASPSRDLVREQATATDYRDKVAARAGSERFLPGKRLACSSFAAVALQ
jgi:hypothetical protein